MDHMAKLSEFIIENPQCTSFLDLRKIVADAGQRGLMHMEFDVKPDYIDTPRNWNWQLEAVFIRGKA